MNRLQTFGDLKKVIAGSSMDEAAKKGMLATVETIQKELDYTQQAIPPSSIQKGELQIRKAGVVRVRLKWATETTDYKMDTTLLTRDPETGSLSLATSSPLYDRRRKDSFDVDCSMPGTLKWEIKAF